jgi:hypothetical protein
MEEVETYPYLGEECQPLSQLCKRVGKLLVRLIRVTTNHKILGVLGHVKNMVKNMLLILFHKLNYMLNDVDDMILFLENALGATIFATAFLQINVIIHMILPHKTQSNVIVL